MKYDNWVYRLYGQANDTLKQIDYTKDKSENTRMGGHPRLTHQEYGMSPITGMPVVLWGRTEGDVEMVDERPKNQLNLEIMNTTSKMELCKILAIKRKGESSRGDANVPIQAPVLPDAMTEYAREGDFARPILRHLLVGFLLDRGFHDMLPFTSLPKDLHLLVELFKDVDAQYKRDEVVGQNTGWKNLSHLARLCRHLRTNHVGCNNILDDLWTEIKIAITECTDIMVAQEKYKGDIYAKLERNPSVSQKWTMNKRWDVESLTNPQSVNKLMYINMRMDAFLKIRDGQWQTPTEGYWTLTSIPSEPVRELGQLIKFTLATPPEKNFKAEIRKMFTHVRLQLRPQSLRDIPDAELLLRDDRTI